MKLILYLIKYAHYLLNHQGKILLNGPLNKTEATFVYKFTELRHLLKVNYLVATRSTEQVIHTIITRL